MPHSDINPLKESAAMHANSSKGQPGQASLSAKDEALHHTTPLEAVLNEVLGKEALSMKDEFKTVLHKAKAHLMEALRGQAQKIVEEALAEEIGALEKEAASIQRPATQQAAASIPIPSISAPSPVAQPAVSQAEQEDLYQGVVKLTLNSHSMPRQMVNFVAELCQNPALRLLRMEGNGAEKAPDVWLALREPMDLKKVLKGMKEVDLVDASSGETSVFEEEMASLQHWDCTRWRARGKLGKRFPSLSRRAHPPRWSDSRWVRITKSMSEGPSPAVLRPCKSM